jgi:hypothetical protein
MLTLPSNMTARVQIPKLQGQKGVVKLDGKEILVRRDGDCWTLDPVGSGMHYIEIQ